MPKTRPAAAAADPLRAALPAPLDFLAAMNAAAFNRPDGPGPVPEGDRAADAASAACVAAAFPLLPAERVHPAPWYAAAVAVAYEAAERAETALWQVEHLSDLVRLCIAGGRVPGDVQNRAEAVLTALDTARRTADDLLGVVRAAIEAAPEAMPPDAWARLLAANTEHARRVVAEVDG